MILCRQTLWVMENYLSYEKFRHFWLMVLDGSFNHLRKVVLPKKEKMWGKCSCWRLKLWKLNLSKSCSKPSFLSFDKKNVFHHDFSCLRCLVSRKSCRRKLLHDACQGYFAMSQRCLFRLLQDAITKTLWVNMSRVKSISFSTQRPERKLAFCSLTEHN